MNHRFKTGIFVFVLSLMAIPAIFSQNKNIEEAELNDFTAGGTSFISCSDDVPDKVKQIMNTEFETHGFTLNECKSYKTSKQLLKKTPEFIIIHGWKTIDKNRGIFVCEAPRYTNFFIFFFNLSNKQLYFTPTSNNKFLEFDLTKVILEMGQTKFHLLPL